MFQSNQEQKILEIEIEQYTPLLPEEAVVEFLIYNNSVGAPKVGLFEEVINYFLVY